MFNVIVYDVFNNTHTYAVPTKEAGREYSKRIITEGLWDILTGGVEIFLPVHQIVKVKIEPRGEQPEPVKAPAINFKDLDDIREHVEANPAYAMQYIREALYKIEQLKAQLLERDAVWLPAKDAEIEQLRAERYRLITIAWGFDLMVEQRFRGTSGYMKRRHELEQIAADHIAQQERGEA